MLYGTSTATDYPWPRTSTAKKSEQQHPVRRTDPLRASLANSEFLFKSGLLLSFKYKYLKFPVSIPFNLAQGVQVCQASGPYHVHASHVDS